MKSPDEWSVEIESLLLEIDASFTEPYLPNEMGPPAYGRGDPWGEETTNAILCKEWRSIDQKRLLYEGGGDIRFHIRPKAFVYYLPALMSAILRARDFGWFEEALLPIAPGYDDVLIEFSGGVVESSIGGANQYVTEQYGSRVNLAKDKLNKRQRECVARYLEIACTYRLDREWPNMMPLLRKWTDFWRSNKDRADAISIAALCNSIKQSFPSAIPQNGNAAIAYATGDASSVLNIVNVLNWRDWVDISFEDLQNCGAAELLSYLLKEAFTYYLPSLLSCTLSPNNKYSRLHEIVPIMLLPADESFRDVWLLYSDGQLDDFVPDAPNFAHAQHVYDRVAHAKCVLTSEQKDCIAKYLRIVLQHETLPEDMHILDRFVQYWNS